MNKFFSTLILSAMALSTTAQNLPVPAAPPSCNASNCVTNGLIDACTPGSNNVVSVTQDGTYNRGNSTNHLGAGAIWRYRNMATVSGVTINVEVTIDETYLTSLVNIDDDAAKDQNNGSMATYFCPKIAPSENLNGVNGGDSRGYVQFTMKFYKNSTGSNQNNANDFATEVTLANLNYVHYDIDGFSTGNNVGLPGKWFRETGLAKKVGANNPQVLANSVTDMSAYSYTDDGSDWTGYAGGVCEKDGVSKCAQNVAAFKYNGAFKSITFRMGYDFNPGNGAGKPARQFGSRLGCFNFPQQSILPVSVISFNAIFRNSVSTLKWVSANEVNFESYIVERSNDGLVFSEVGTVAAQGTEIRRNYEFSDDLSGVSGTVFYYRLKLLDIDRKYSYTSTILIRKEGSALNSIVLSPNPVRGSMSTVRFSAKKSSVAELRVLDMSGRSILQQQAKIYEGTNSISINQVDKLIPGIYTLQIQNDGEISVIKFSVVH